MKSFWGRVADRLDRVPSGCGLPMLVVVGVVFWIVVLKLMRL